MNRLIIFFFLIISVNLVSQNNNYIWEIALPGKVVLTPIERKDGELILACDDRRLYSIDSETGNINWKIKPGGRISFLDISSDGSIIVADDKKIYSFYSSGDLRWSLDFLNGFVEF